MSGPEEEGSWALEPIRIPAPSELPPCPTTFRFNNNGKKRHELNLFLLKPA